MHNSPFGMFKAIFGMLGIYDSVISIKKIASHSPFNMFEFLQ